MRPRKCRIISVDPKSTLYKPAGIPSTALEFVQLEMEEMEAIRLAYCENLYHDKAGEQMGISRQTFSRILGSANRKIADALIHGKGLEMTRSPDQP